MARYVVLESDIETKEQKIRVMRDGFAVIAIGLPLPWLLFNRLWFEAVLLLPFVIAIAITPFSVDTFLLVLVCNLSLGLIIALEGDGRAIAKAKRRGYREIGVVPEAHTLEEAELYATYSISQQTPGEPMGPKKPEAVAEGDDDPDMILGLAKA